MPKYLIIDKAKGTMLELNTKRIKFIDMLQEAKDYLELPKAVKDKIKAMVKVREGKQGK